MNSAFTFFQSYYTAAQLLNDKQRLEFYDCLGKAGIMGETPDPQDVAVKALLTIAMPLLAKNVAAIESGKAGGKSRKKNSPSEESEDNPSEGFDETLSKGIEEPLPTYKNKNMNKNMNMDLNKNLNTDENKNLNKNIDTPPLPPSGGPETDDGFEKFWEAYPKKVAKVDARKAWEKGIKDKAIDPGDVSGIIDAVKRAAKSEEWTKEGGRYIPHPATWINAQRWNDETVKPASKFIQQDDQWLQGWKEILAEDGVEWK